jgi:hypothetical protein
MAPITVVKSHARWANCSVQVVADLYAVSQGGGSGAVLCWRLGHRVLLLAAVIRFNFRWDTKE